MRTDDEIEKQDSIQEQLSKQRYFFKKTRTIKTSF